MVRFAVVMLVLYAGILAFGLNEFRTTPQGFIPQIDRGILIVAAQLPPGASLQRTDEVMRKATDLVQATPGVAHSVVIVGFSGATFTNAPNAGAMFVVLEPFTERAKDPAKSDRRYSTAAVPEARRHAGSHDDRRAAAAGLRHRQCRRLPHDGRGPRRRRTAGSVETRSMP